MSVGSCNEAAPPRQQPVARMPRELVNRLSAGVMRPQDPFVGRVCVRAPRLQRLASDERANQLALNEATSSRSFHRGGRRIAGAHVLAYDERRVAPAFHAEMRPAEAAFAEGYARGGQAIECRTNIGRNEEPRARGVLVEAEPVARDDPS